MLASGGRPQDIPVPETKALLNPTVASSWTRVGSLGTGARPTTWPSCRGDVGEYTLKVAKARSARYLDTCGAWFGAGRGVPGPRPGGQVLELTRNFGIGAQFGGKYSATMCGSSGCSARDPAGGHRGVLLGRSAGKAKITADGVFLEQLERDPARFLPDISEQELAAQSSADVVRWISTGRCPRSRAAGHAAGEDPSRADRVDGGGAGHATRRIEERLDAGESDAGLSARCTPVYYAGPARPSRYASARSAPTTAGRWTPTWRSSRPRGGSMVMPGQGNRVDGGRRACQRPRVLLGVDRRPWPGITIEPPAAWNFST